MRSLIYISISIYASLITHAHGTKNIFTEAERFDPQPILTLALEIELIREIYVQRISEMEESLKWCKIKMQDVEHFGQWHFYWSLSEVYREERLVLIKKFNESIVRLKYLKGLEVIKLLYEKTLTLDHHFSSVITMNEIGKLSNPNQFKEFDNLKDYLDSERNKDGGFDLSPILGSNVYTSVVHSLVALFVTGSKKSDKQKKLKDIECILDFTLSMHQDLTTIYFETEYLQQGNTNIKEDLQDLFQNFVQPIGYSNSLDHCRSMDDWDVIRKLLNTYLESNTDDNENAITASEHWIEIDFPVFRLIQFISRYNMYIDQGDRFYEKFYLMLTSYQHEAICAEKLPDAFRVIQENINQSLKKFKTAYNPLDINGTRLKAILYGINEYKQ